MRIYVCTDIFLGQTCILRLSTTQWFSLIEGSLNAITIHGCHLNLTSPAVFTRKLWTAGQVSNTVPLSVSKGCECNHGRDWLPIVSVDCAHSISRELRTWVRLYWWFWNVFPYCVHTRIYVCTDISVGQTCILRLSTTQWFSLIEGSLIAITIRGCHLNLTSPAVLTRKIWTAGQVSNTVPLSSIEGLWVQPWSWLVTDSIRRLCS